MDALKLIQQLGYTKREAKVYLATLRLGEAHISDIAQAVGMPRSSVQAIADKLHKDGLLNFYTMRRYRYWVAEHPQRLLDRLKRRESSMAQAMPELVALKRAAWGKRRVKNMEPAWEMLRVLADGAALPVLIANERGDIVYVNERFEQLTGYSFEEVRGKNPRIFHSGETPKRVYTQMWETLKRERLFHTDEIVNQHRSGTMITIRTAIFPVRHRNTLLYVQLVDDITTERRTNALNRKIRHGV